MADVYTPPTPHPHARARSCARARSTATRPRAWSSRWRTSARSTSARRWSGSGRRVRAAAAGWRLVRRTGCQRAPAPPAAQRLPPTHWINTSAWHHRATGVTVEYISTQQQHAPEGDGGDAGDGGGGASCSGLACPPLRFPESVGDTHARYAAAFEAIARRAAGASMLVVTHGEVRRGGVWVGGRVGIAWLGGCSGPFPLPCAAVVFACR